MQPHVHDTGEYLTVLSGVLYMSFVRDGEWTELSPGSVIAIPPGVPMWAKTGDKETVIEVNGVGPFQTDPVPEEIVPEE
jgi:quercetin dioxygenase-like cupin family protein